MFSLRDVMITSNLLLFAVIVQTPEFVLIRKSFTTALRAAVAGKTFRSDKAWV